MAIISVAIGENIQTKLDTAIPGDIVELEPGVHPTLSSKLMMRANGVGASRIKVRTAGVFPTVRVTEAEASSFAQITGPAASAVIGCDLAASRYTWENILVNGQPGRTIIETHYVPATTVAEVPFDIEYERMLIIGDPAGSLRGISLNGANIDVRRIMTRNIKMTTNGDTQALAGWAGPGPFDIIDCDLEACGENILFGGALTGIPNLVPSNILIEDCDLFKRLEWRGIFIVKNIFELKNAENVTMRRCRLKYCWTSGQTGSAIVLTPTPVSQTTPDTWVRVATVLIDKCRVTSVGGVLNALGRHRYDYGYIDGVTVQDCLFEDVKAEWGGHGEIAKILGGVDNLTVNNNIADHYGDNVLMLENTTVNFVEYKNNGLIWSNNLHKQGQNGIFGGSLGQAGLDLRAPGAVVNPNRIGGRTSKWPAQDTGATIALVDFPATFATDVATWESTSGPPPSGEGEPGIPPDFGKLSIGATLNNFSAGNSVSLSRFTLNAARNFARLKIYFKGTHVDHIGGLARGVIYSTNANGDPDALIAVTQEVFVPDDLDDWQNFPFNETVALAAGDYYLGVWSQNTLIGAMDAAGVNRYRLSVPYSSTVDPPNPLATFSSSSFQKSIYAIEGLVLGPSTGETLYTLLAESGESLLSELGEELWTEDYVPGSRVWSAVSGRSGMSGGGTIY